MRNARRARSWWSAVTRVIVVAAMCVGAAAAPAPAQEATPSDTPGFWAGVAETTPAGQSERPREAAGFWSRALDGTGRIWSTGRHDVYLSGYSAHLPWRYDEDGRERLNTANWGAGYGRSVSTGSREWMVYGLAFRDSHWEPQYLVGWAWMKGGTAGPLQLAAGYTGFLTGREEWANWCPVPGVLPLVSVGIPQLKVYATYIPGWDTLYAFGRVSLGRQRGADADRGAR